MRGRSLIGSRLRLKPLKPPIHRGPDNGHKGIKGIDYTLRPLSSEGRVWDHRNDAWYIHSVSSGRVVQGIQQFCPCISAWVYESHERLLRSIS